MRIRVRGSAGRHRSASSPHPSSLQGKKVLVSARRAQPSRFSSFLHGGLDRQQQIRHHRSGTPQNLCEAFLRKRCRFLSGTGHKKPPNGCSGAGARAVTPWVLEKPHGGQSPPLVISKPSLGFLPPEVKKCQTLDLRDFSEFSLSITEFSPHPVFLPSFLLAPAAPVRGHRCRATSPLPVQPPDSSSVPARPNKRDGCEPFPTSGPTISRTRTVWLRANRTHIRAAHHPTRPSDSQCGRPHPVVELRWLDHIAAVSNGTGSPH